LAVTVKRQSDQGTGLLGWELNVSIVALELSLSNKTFGLR